MASQLAQAISDLDEAQSLALVQQGLAQGASASDLLAECREGMGLIGKRFEAGEYFLSDLIMAGEVFKAVGNELTPHLAAGQGSTKGTVVVGTVKGDIHDIGKDIVVTMLRGSGYQVEDLGVDVPVEAIVDCVKQTGAKIVGLSGLLTISFDPMKETVAKLRAVDPNIKVMIGGGPVTEQVREYTGADAVGVDAQAAVTLANGWN